MPTTAVNLGNFPYGSNPIFTLTFQQAKVSTDPASAPNYKASDEVGTQYTGALTHSGAGVYTFRITGGLMVFGMWTGRGFAPSGTGQASIDFYFTVDPTANP